MFKILQASLKDLKELHALEKACFEQDAWSYLDLIGVLTFPATVRLKAVKGEKMVGFIGGDIRSSKNTGWIITVGVLPDYRNQGIAKTLLERCEKELNMPLVKLCVRRSNTPAIQLYEKYGYKKVGIWEKYYSGNEDAFVYEKRR